jgi:hypothetical protein
VVCGGRETDGAAVGAGVDVGRWWSWALDAAEAQINSANVENSSRYRHALALLIIVGPFRDHSPQRLDQGDRNGTDHRDTENSPQKEVRFETTTIPKGYLKRKSICGLRSLFDVPVPAPGDALC